MVLEFSEVITFYDSVCSLYSEVRSYVQEFSIVINIKPVIRDVWCGVVRD